MGASADLARLYNSKPALVPIEDFNQQDRERVLEILLAQERVVNILYGKSAVGANNPRNQLGFLNVTDYGGAGPSSGSVAGGLSPVSIGSTPGYNARQSSGVLLLDSDYNGTGSAGVGAGAGSNGGVGMSMKQSLNLDGRPNTTGNSTAPGSAQDFNGGSGSGSTTGLLPQLSARPGSTR